MECEMQVQYNNLRVKAFVHAVQTDRFKLRNSRRDRIQVLKIHLHLYREIRTIQSLFFALWCSREHSEWMKPLWFSSRLVTVTKSTSTFLRFYEFIEDPRNGMKAFAATFPSCFQAEEKKKKMKKRNENSLREKTYSGASGIVKTRIWNFNMLWDFDSREYYILYCSAYLPLYEASSDISPHILKTPRSNFLMIQNSKY